MNKKATEGEQSSRLQRLAALPDEKIDTSDIPEVADWSSAVRGHGRSRKEAVTIRLDADVLAFFRNRGRQYQTEINRALREWVREHQKFP